MDFKEILIQKYKFTETDWENTIIFFTPEIFKAKKYFLEFGKVSDKIGLVKKGLLRTYIIDQSGNDYTIHFNLPGTVVISIDSINNQVPSNESIVAIEDSELLTINYQNLQKLLEKVPSFQQICKDVAELKSKYLIDRTIQLQTHTATERYLEFCKRYPEISKKVALNHIASYLGIDIATLSRIRKKL